MAFERERAEALHLLTGIENGTLSVTAAGHQLADADPALVYLIFTWLRQKYGRDHPAAEGVIGRLVELTSTVSSVAKMMREGKSDPISQWFEDEHEYRELDAESFIELIVTKLEG